MTLVVLLLVFVFFRFTPLGLAMRAAAQNPVSSRLVGIRVGWMLALGWGLAAAIGAIAGMMVAPIVFLEPNMMARHPAVRIRRRVAGRHRQPGRRGARRLHRRRAGERGRHVPVGTELKLTVALVHHRRRADGAPSGLFGKVHVAGCERMNAFSRTLRATGLEPPSLAGLAASLLLLACALPFVLGNYRVFQLTLALTYAIALLGLNMLTGYNGQISLGHGAFFAIGAYTAAILMDKAGCRTGPPFRSPALVCLRRGLPVRPAGAAARGPVPRAGDFRARRGDAADPQVQGPRALDRRRRMGIVIVKPDAPAGLPLTQDQWLYFFTLAWPSCCSSPAGTCCAGASAGRWWRFATSRSPAQAMGVNTRAVQVAHFRRVARSTPASPARWAPSWCSSSRPIASPSSCRSRCWSGVVVGGLASISGAIYGALFIQFIPNIADQISKAAPWAIYGVFLIGFMYLMPSGVAGSSGCCGSGSARVRPGSGRPWCAS